MSLKAGRMSTTKKNGHKNILSLEEKLWAAADKMRGHVDAAEYKHIILGLIFLKYISDIFEEYRSELQAKGADEEDRHNYDKVHVFWLPERARWSYLQMNSESARIRELVDEAMMLIEQENSGLENALSKDYARSSLDKDRLRGLIELISTIKLGDKHSRSKDVLGHVYEYFLGRFAGVERRGGEFYTPQSVVKLLVKMVEPFRGIVYDPCCGSGGMFVQSENFVLAHGGCKDDISIYGQELNPTTWKLCKMNLMIRGITGNVGREAADTFHNDLHKNIQADFILANPPFNLSDWAGEKLHLDSRWRYGVPPDGNANMAWVQHIISHLSPSGIAGLVLTNGSLSLGQEVEIRKSIIKADLVDCIIALPGQLFYNTQIAACLWFIARDKKYSAFRDRSGRTLFIDAHHLGKAIDRTHYELTDQEICYIVDTYHTWRGENGASTYKDAAGFCREVKIDEIESHHWSLVPGRYVGFDNKESEDWDISRLQQELVHVEARLAEISEASENALAILKEMFHG